MPTNYPVVNYPSRYGLDFDPHHSDDQQSLWRIYKKKQQAVPRKIKNGILAGNKIWYVHHQIKSKRSCKSKSLESIYSFQSQKQGKAAYSWQRDHSVSCH